MASLEPLDIIIKIQQQEKLAELKLQAKEAAGEIVKLNQSLQGGTLNQTQFNAQAHRYGVTLSNVIPQIKTLESANRGLGQGLGQLAYAIDDVQYGFNAIVNNIPQIVLGLGGSAGVAGAIGIAAVAINQLVKHWDDLVTAFDAWKSGDTVAGLQAVKKAADDAAESFKKLAEKPTTEQAGGMKVIDQFVQKHGAEGLAQAVAQAVSQDPTLQAKLTAAEKLGPAGGGGGELGGPMTAGLSQHEIDMLLGQKNRKKADTLIGAAAIAGPAGDIARGELARIMPGFQQLDPMNVKAQQQEEADKDIRKEAINNQNEVVAHRLNAEHKLSEELKRDRKQRAHDEDAEEKKVWEKGKDRRLQALQDQRDALQEQEHHIRFAASMRKGDSAAYGSTKAMLADIRQGAYDAGATVSKNQLKKLEMIHLELVKLREQEKQNKRGGNFQ